MFLMRWVIPLFPQFTVSCLDLLAILYWTFLSGPPALVFRWIMVTFFLYLIPSAIINSDISVAYPMVTHFRLLSHQKAHPFLSDYLNVFQDGGAVMWIDEAFGSTVGAQSMYWYD